jgi:membrane metallo-endopeptidase-like protein 1
MITHYTGRQYDKDGNLMQWWSDEAIAKFKVKAQCIIDQYGNFTVPEAGLNVRIYYTDNADVYHSYLSILNIN